MKTKIIAGILHDAKPLSCTLRITTESGDVIACRTEEGDDGRLVLREFDFVLIVRDDEKTAYIDTDKIESIEIS